MAHYAFLDKNNVVTEVIVGIDENQFIDNVDSELWYEKFRGQFCKRTSYNGKIRKQFAGIGYKYDEINDIFIKPQPYPSWTLNDNFDWEAPSPLPDRTPFKYQWDESTLAWIERKSYNHNA